MSVATQPDLTRWNRAGLSKFTYVDGNAALFLEHLRAKMIANFLRGLPETVDERKADYWFDLFRNDDHSGPTPDRQAELDEALVWAALQTGLPSTVETRVARNRRLIENYKSKSDDYAVEIMRALARAAHVLSGYADAYANEAYLGTATQWESLRKLGAMVNYSPIPAASASTVVALLLKEGSGTVTVKKGLAMSATLAEGGAPLVFETLENMVGHPDLNAVRERRWNVNRTFISIRAANRWLLQGQDAPKPGEPVLIAPRKMTEPSAKAMLVATVEADKASDTAKIVLQGDGGGKWRAGYTELWYNADDAQIGLARSGEIETIVKVGETAQYNIGGLVEVRRTNGSNVFAVVTSVSDGQVGLSADISLEKADGIKPLTPLAFPNGYVETGLDIRNVYFNLNNAVTNRAVGSITFDDHNRVITGVRTSDGEDIANRYAAPAGAVTAGIPATNIDFETVSVLADPPRVTASLSNPKTTIGFPGSPPADLTNGAYYVARGADDELIPLRVRGIREEENEYFIAFNKSPPSPPETTTFFGPLKNVLYLEDHDRAQDPILDADGAVVLAGLSDEAKNLIKVGSLVTIEDERETGPAPVLATVGEIVRDPSDLGFAKGERDQAEVRFTGLAANLAPFVKGWTVFRFNTVPTGHGESKGSKILGSGNGELPRQTFTLDVKNVSAVTDSRAESGVRPDITVTVDDANWDYADLTNPEAEDQPRYSIRPRDDDKLDIVFRRRLQSGKNNVRVSHHRIGSGSQGNGLPPGSFTKTKSKHRFVEAIVQPFETSGGADQESIHSIRQNAGAAIAANGRAVSLEDFTRLARRHASVWDAKAERILGSGRGETVRITVLPADGAELTERLISILKSFIGDRSLPGTRINIQSFTSIPFTVEATIRIDENQYVAEDVVLAAEMALLETFGLENRVLGQGLFIAEVLSTLESVEGAETAQATMAIKAGTVLAEDQTFSSSSGVLRAIYPKGTQVAFIEQVNDIVIKVEGLT